MIKRACLDALADALRAALPPTVDVDVCAADWEEPTKFPAVRVLPGRFSLDTSQEEEVDDTQADKLFVQVGEFVGSVEVRVSARNRTQRENVEDYVLNWLLSPEWTPGTRTVLVSGVVVGGIATTYAAPCTFELTDEEWREEMAFSDKRFSFVDLQTTFPALAMRTQTYTIQDLRLVMEADINLDLSAPANVSAEEALKIDEFGNVTKTTP